MNEFLLVEPQNATTPVMQPGVKKNFSDHETQTPGNATTVEYVVNYTRMKFGLVKFCLVKFSNGEILSGEVLSGKVCVW
jgi:hypothetical protein